MKFQELYQTRPIIPRRKKSISELSHLPKADLANCRVHAHPRFSYSSLEFCMENAEIAKDRVSVDKVYKKTRRWSMLLF